MTTPYQKHVARWRKCTACPLATRRSKVVFTRGTLPCDVLFVGEAPGASEDVLGRPFVGPAGKLLDVILERALPAACRYAITNLVGCMPKDETNEKGEPPEEAIKACRPKLQELLALARPKAVVCVGSLARKHTPEVRGTKRAELIHPAAILRMDVSQQGLAVQRCVVTLQNLCDDLNLF